MAEYLYPADQANLMIDELRGMNSALLLENRNLKNALARALAVITGLSARLERRGGEHESAGSQ